MVGCVKGASTVGRNLLRASFIFCLFVASLIGVSLVGDGLAIAQTNRPSSTTTTSTVASTTTTPEVVVQTVENASSSGPIFSTGRRIFATVTLLTLLGIGLIVLTVLYWRHTRPAGKGDAKKPETPDSGDGPKSEKATIGPIDPMLADALKSESGS